MALEFWHESHVAMYLLGLGQKIFTSLFYQMSFFRNFYHFRDINEHTWNMVTFLSHIGPESHQTNDRKMAFLIGFDWFFSIFFIRICRELLWAIDVTILSHMRWKLMWHFWVTNLKNVVSSKFWWSSFVTYIVCY